MHFQLTRLTEEVVQLEFMDDNVSSSVLLNAMDVSLLEEMLEVCSELAVSEQVNRWYNG